MLIPPGGLPRCLPLHPTAALLTTYLLTLNPPLPRRIHASAVRYDSRDANDDSLSHLREANASEAGFVPLAAPPSGVVRRVDRERPTARVERRGSRQPRSKPATSYLLDSSWRTEKETRQERRAVTARHGVGRHRPPLNFGARHEQATRHRESLSSEVKAEAGNELGPSVSPQMAHVEESEPSATPVKPVKVNTEDGSHGITTNSGEALDTHVLEVEVDTKDRSDDATRSSGETHAIPVTVAEVNTEDGSDDITRSSREARAKGSSLSAAPRQRDHPTHAKGSFMARSRAPGRRKSLLDSSWREEQPKPTTSKSEQPSPEFLRIAAARGKKSAWGRGPWDVLRLDTRAQRSNIRDAKHEEARTAAMPAAAEERQTQATPTSKTSAMDSRQQHMRLPSSESTSATGSQTGSVTREPNIRRKNSANPQASNAAPGLSSSGPLSKADEQRMKKLEPAGELSEEERAMFQRIAREHIKNMPKSPVSAVSEDAKSSEGAISILQELFPRELSRKTQASLHKSERHVPRMPMGMPPAKEQASETIHEEKEEQDLIRRVHPYTETIETLTVLVLRKASKHLTENDFHRLVPSGKHIEGWTVAGRLLHIIRAREMDTLQPTGDYFLVFSTKIFASRYLEHATKLHHHSQFHSPHTTSQSIPPAPTLARGAKTKFTDPAYTYNLLPPTHNFSMRLVDQPFSPILQRIIVNGGYHRLIANRQSSFEVLLWFTNLFYPSFSTVSRCIDEDGKQRGVFWQTIGPDRGIRILEDAPAASAPGEPEQYDVDAGLFGMEGHRRREWKQRTAFGATRFIVSFKDAEEANRFVMAWHRRDATTLVEEKMMEAWRGEPILGQAELIW